MKKVYPATLVPLAPPALKDPPAHHSLKHQFRSFPTPTLVISNLVLMVQPDPQAQMARPVVPVPLARPAPWERLARPELGARLAQLAPPALQVEPASLDRTAKMVPPDRKAQWATPAIPDHGAQPARPARPAQLVKPAQMAPPDRKAQWVKLA